MLVSVLFFSAIVLGDSSGLTRPLVFWSKSESTPVHQSNDLTVGIEHVLSLVDPQKEKLTFGFLFDSLDFDSLQGLKTKIADSTDPLDSVFMPFVTGSFKISPSRNGMRAKSFDDFLKNYRDDVSVVVFEPSTQAELLDLFDKTHKYEKESAESNVGYFVTATSPKDKPLPQSHFKGTIYTQTYVATNGTVGETYVGPISVTPFTLQALLISLIVFMGGYIGNCCLNDVQIPITYPHETLDIRKEF